MARYNDPLALTPLTRFGIGAQKRQLLALVAVAALIERGRESDRERERERAQAGRRTRDTSLPSFQQAPVSPIEPSLQLTRRNMPCLGRPACVCGCLCVWLVLPHSSLSASKTSATTEVQTTQRQFAGGNQQWLPRAPPPASDANITQQWLLHRHAHVWLLEAVSS